MKLVALYFDEAKRRHWIVEWLRTLGFLAIILAEIVSLLFGSTIVGPLVEHVAGGASPATDLSVLILCAVIGLVGGLCLGLPWWGLSMLLDDLHAIRLQTAAYVSQDERGPAHED